jgi:Acetoacetate decarboxylase (ADC)
MSEPLRFADAGAFMGVFPARLRALHAMAPDPSVRPARIAPGVGLLAVVAYRYRESPVGPYDEVGILIPLSRSDLQVHWLPVDREAAMEGSDVWAFPTGLADITLEELGDGGQTCRLGDADGLVLELHCGAIRTRERRRESRSFMHAWHDGRDQVSEVRVTALEQGWSVRPGAARLVLGDRHPRARELAGALLGTRSLAASSMPRSQSLLFEPGQPKHSRRKSRAARVDGVRYARR